MICGVGADFVAVSSFAEQLAAPTRFAAVFTSRERRSARGQGDEAEHLAAWWAVKEAVVKAFSAALWGQERPLPEGVWHLIEVTHDAYGRPRVVLHGQMEQAVRNAVGDVVFHVSISHDGGAALAFVIMESLESGPGDPVA